MDASRLLTGRKLRVLAGDTMTSGESRQDEEADGVRLNSAAARGGRWEERGGHFLFVTPTAQAAAERVETRTAYPIPSAEERDDGVCGFHRSLKMKLRRYKMDLMSGFGLPPRGSDFIR